MYFGLKLSLILYLTPYPLSKLGRKYPGSHLFGEGGIN
jgi:hypothetical protein